MLNEVSLLEIRQAQAEAMSRVVRGWPPPVDVATRARVVEALARESLDSPRRLRALANDVLDHVPKDGTILDYMNRQREALAGCFAATLDALRATRDQARGLVQAGQRVPSLPALEQAIRDAEQVETDTLAHWTIFEPQVRIDPNDDWLSQEEFLAQLEDLMSPEARRELQN